MSDISVRPMKPLDVRECVRLGVRLWGDGRAVEITKQLSAMYADQHDRPFYLVAVTPGNEIVGWAGFRRSWIMDGAFELIWVNVKPEWQGRGIGRSLTRARIALIQARGGTMITCVTHQVDFFSKMGFKTAGRVHDKVLMFMELETPFATQLVNHEETTTAA